MLDIFKDLQTKDLLVYIALIVLVLAYVKNWANIKFKLGSFSIEGIKGNQDNLQKESEAHKIEIRELQEELYDLKVQLEGKILVDPKEMLSDKIKLLYHTTLIHQMKHMREQSKLYRLEQMKAFSTVFNLNEGGKHYKTYSTLIKSVIQKITEKVYHIFEENHLADEAWNDNNQVNFIKWEQYKNAKIIILWNEQGMDIIKSEFDDTNMEVSRQDIKEKVKDKCYTLFKYYMNVVFDKALCLSIEKVNDLETFKKKHHIGHIELSENVVLGFK